MAPLFKHLLFGSYGFQPLLELATFLPVPRVLPTGNLEFGHFIFYGAKPLYDSRYSPRLWPVQTRRKLCFRGLALTRRRLIRSAKPERSSANP